MSGRDKEEVYSLYTLTGERRWGVEMIRRWLDGGSSSDSIVCSTKVGEWGGGYSRGLF